MTLHQHLPIYKLAVDLLDLAVDLTRNIDAAVARYTRERVPGLKAGANALRELEGGQKVTHHAASPATPSTDP